MNGSALRLARHEWRLILKEPRFLLPFLVTPLLILGIQGFVLFTRGVASPQEAVDLARTLLLLLAVLAPSMAVPLGADTFAGERERNTLEILLCLPVGPVSLFWGKVLGILPIPTLVGWASQSVLLAMLAFRAPLPPEFGPEALKALLLTPAIGLFFCSVTAYISMGAETVRGAAQLCSLVMLALFALILPSSGALYASDAYYGTLLAGLLLASSACLDLARRRFLRLP